MPDAVPVSGEASQESLVEAQLLMSVVHSLSLTDNGRRSESVIDCCGNTARWLGLWAMLAWNTANYLVAEEY